MVLPLLSVVSARISLLEPSARNARGKRDLGGQLRVREPNLYRDGAIDVLW